MREWGTVGEGRWRGRGRVRERQGREQESVFSFEGTITRLLCMWSV